MEVIVNDVPQRQFREPDTDMFLDWDRTWT